MANEKNTNSKKPKFNYYWIYGGIIAIFIAMQFLNGSGLQDAKTITPSQFFEYAKENEVAKVEIINRHEANVYLTKEAQEKETHKKSKPSSFLPSSTKLPNYSFEIGDLQNFENDLKAIGKYDILSNKL